METAKVDLRKLQLLNDRIAQVIDALNQVRFSVHGLQHTAGFVPGVCFGTPNVGIPAYGLGPLNAFATPAQTFMGGIGGIGGIAGTMSCTPTGLNHTAGEGTVDPITAQQIALRYGQPVPVVGGYPYGQAVQFAQTFPWAF